MMEQTDTPNGCGVPVSYDPDNYVPLNRDSNLKVSAFTIGSINKFAYTLNRSAIMSDLNSRYFLRRCGVIHDFVIVLKPYYCPDNYINYLAMNTNFH